MVPRTADRRLGVVRALDAVIADPRDPDLVTHHQVELLRQHIYGLALGYEDLNDHETLRRDLAWQSAVECGEELASSPTLCRLENRADRRMAVAMSRVLVEQFIVLPAAICSRSTCTGMRVPRITGLPLQPRGLSSMRSMGSLRRGEERRHGWQCPAWMPVRRLRSA